MHKIQNSCLLCDSVYSITFANNDSSSSGIKSLKVNEGWDTYDEQE